MMLTDEDARRLLELLDVPFDFVHLADPMPAMLHPERRVPLALLLVAKSHGAGASWKGLHLLNWALRDDTHAELLVALREQRDFPDRPVVRFEPALDRALDLATGLDLLELKSPNVFRLTPTGRRVVKVLEQTNAFLHERELLGRLTGKLTQTDVRRVLEWRDS